MSDTGTKSHKKLAEIFGKMNLSELPAMSNHVSEVLALIQNKRVTAEELAAVILKDYSLTNKVLQVVNSAYYTRGVPITTIERAVTALGIDVIRELAITISVIEEFIKSGVEKEGISKLLTLSFLSASLSKAIVQNKRLPVSPEEAYICTLLHDLGRIIIFIYLPDVYRRIDMARQAGSSEESMAKLMLKGLSFGEVGMEIARFWNFSDTIINAMEEEPPVFDNQLDALLILQHLAVFSNRFTRALCEETATADLMAYYGEAFKMTCPEPLEVLCKLIEATGEVSPVIRYGLTRLKMRSRVLNGLRGCKKLAPA